MESKKAQNLSITTIILIILGVVVLVVLIIGFTKGWGSVKEFFTGGGESDFQKVSSQCSIACATMDEISWCKVRTLEGDSENCKFFANKYTSIEGCTAMPECPRDTEALKCEGYEYEPGKTAIPCKTDTKVCVGKGINAPEGKLFVEASTDLCCDSLGCKDK